MSKTTPPEEGREEETLCQRCERPGAERYHQNTRYVEEERNWVTLCPECRKENDEHWNRMWSDFYSDVL